MRQPSMFFFFKQKTAYEMLRSLVGSEMCIRDRYQRRPTHVNVIYELNSNGGQSPQNDAASPREQLNIVEEASLLRNNSNHNVDMYIVLIKEYLIVCASGLGIHVIGEVCKILKPYFDLECVFVFITLGLLCLSFNLYKREPRSRLTKIFILASIICACLSAIDFLLLVRKFWLTDSKDCSPYLAFFIKEMININIAIILLLLFYSCFIEGLQVLVSAAS
eukprot:TRINITY_DN10416_c0_g1_i6.p1 TRINITY_DN10416_c0_g1~~TRINITY_DN10416_c0_g1_i6.p1  ORF type:complete len:220 (-),score=40.27 TRINITY_DN10416_c0_g1_i6:13-672(-)